jgi:hypothetical protein
MVRWVFFSRITLYPVSVEESAIILANKAAIAVSLTNL